MDTTMKIFRDNVHGYIEIPNEYVKLFIDTPIFQRLRGIEQTGMRVLYPSARHDRFIHSLGTYFLGHKAFNYFKKNIENTYGENSESNYYNVCDDMAQSEKFWEKYRILFEIACLLHDCGHAPFSHTMEFHYAKEIISEDGKKHTEMSLSDKLIEYNSSYAFTRDFNNSGSPHEQMSALLVCTEYRDAIKQVLKNDTDIADNVEFVARAIIGCTYQDDSSIENQIKNCLIQLLNSDSIDVDSLDYIIRDSKLSGVDNINIDIDRLLGSLTLVEITECKDALFPGNDISTNILEGYLKSSESGSAQIKGHIKGAFSVDEAKNSCVNGTISVSGIMKIKDDVNIHPADSPAIISVNGALYNKKINKLDSFAQVNIYGITETPLNFDSSELIFRQETNAEIEIFSNEITINSAFVDAKISGLFSGKLLGKQKTKGITKCCLGFHKSSLSVIQNVIMARNYEYKWIYSHHKVVYYSNYLLIDLLRQCVSLLSQDHEKDGASDNTIASILSWRTMIEKNNSNKIYQLANEQLSLKFFRPDDADIIGVFKQCYLYCLKSEDDKIKDEEVVKLLNEYYSRIYRKSLWKSYAEFEIFLNPFTAPQQKKLFNLLVENSKYRLIDQYGYLSDEWQEYFSMFGMDDVVWVNGDSKLKNLKPDKTFILFKDGSRTYRSVSSSDDIKPVSKLDLFYIYYRDNGRELDKTALIDFFKKQLLNSK